MNLLLRPVRARTFIPVMLVTVLAVFVGVTLLPHDRYVRFQSLRGTLHTRAEWVYDRIHNDPTPIDVLIVGPSRTVAGIDPQLLQSDLRQQTGVPLQVADLGYAEPGLDLPYLMVREAFSTKRPKLVIVGILEHQTRDGHPAFKDLGDVRDVIEAPILINKSYFSNLAFLPMRQLRLWTESMFAPWLGYRHAFDPTHYPGPDIDPEATFPVHQPKPSTQAQLEEQAPPFVRSLTHAYLPSSLSNTEFAAERTYLTGIARLAAEHHAKLLFVYLPAYKAPAAPLDQSYYEKLGPVLIPPASIRTNPDDYFDLYHLNATGKQQLTTWLATNLDQTVIAWQSDQDSTDAGKK